MSVYSQPHEAGLVRQLFGRVFHWLWRLDILQIIICVLLIGMSLCFLYGTGLQSGEPNLWRRQLLWVVIGSGFWLLLSFYPYQRLGFWSLIFYPASIIALIAVFFIGVRVYGALRWIQVGPLRVQPSEFAKLAIVFLLAWVMSLPGFRINDPRYLSIVLAIAGLPFLLILRQPDLGSAFVLLPVVAAMIFVSGLNWRWILAVALAVLIALPALYHLVFVQEKLLRDYQRERILVFLDPERDPRDKGWNSLQSELAVGSGGLWGKGFMQGTQNTLGFLPRTVSKNDFIFSVIAEEAGFAGAVAIITGYILLICSGLWTAITARDRMGRALAVGMTSIIFVHTAVNIGMTIRLMPVTGLPLPLISYGGSFMISTLICLGVLQSVHVYRRQKRT